MIQPTKNFNYDSLLIAWMKEKVSLLILSIFNISFHLIFLIEWSETERGADSKTYAYYRNEIQKISIDKFKEASGFECSVKMMEDSIKSFKSDIFDYKLLANAHKRYSYNKKWI